MNKSIRVGTMSLWGVGAANESTLFVVLTSTPSASWCGIIVVVQRMFGVGLMFGVRPVPVDDMVVSCELAFLFEAMDGSAVPPPLEPISRMHGGDSSLSVRSHRPAALNGIPRGLFNQKGSAWQSLSSCPIVS